MRVFALLCLTSFLLAGCSAESGDVDATPTVTETATVTQTETETATVTQTETETATVTQTETETATVTQTVSATPAGDADASISGDVTEQFVEAYARYPWEPLVIKAEVAERGRRMTIETALVDPRGRDGSDEAMVGIDICRAGADWLQAQGVSDPAVTVMERDGTTFIMLGQSTGGLCSEV